MIKLIRQAAVYAPEYLGLKDVLLVGDKIGAISDHIDICMSETVELEIIEGKGKLLVPGFIDSHVHLIGGGGEGGYKTRTPEIMLSDITRNGVTTLVGCLGTDGIGRDMVALLAKARGLDEEGVTTFIYTGSYRIPITTITDDVMKDLIAIDKVIGVGEIAISDHRSSQPSLDELKRLAADARVGGILSGKAGIMNVHIGDGRGMLKMLSDIVEETEIPYTQFLPTHINRNPYLFEDGIRYAKAGGFIDFTTSTAPAHIEAGETGAAKALKRSLEAGISSEQITFSSDGQGSLPVFNERNEFVGLGIGTLESLYAEMKKAVLNESIPMETAIKVITSNPAAILKLKGKGRISKGFDADLCLLDERTLEVDTVIARGRIMIRNKEIKVFGTFEA